MMVVVTKSVMKSKHEYPQNFIDMIENGLKADMRDKLFFIMMNARNCEVSIGDIEWTTKESHFIVSLKAHLHKTSTPGDGNV